MTARTRRRSPGSGGVYGYRTGAGQRWRVKGAVTLADGTVRQVHKRGFLTRTAAREWLADAQADGRKGGYIEPSRERLGTYGAQVIEGLRLKPQTHASYAKNWRLHVEPYLLASLPLAQVTGAKLTAHYQVLEKSGRKDHRAGEGLSARTTRYVHVIIHRVLAQAVKDGQLPRNPADAATPPTAREARPPEMTCWSAAQLAAFMGWARENAANYPLWHLLAMTGMRRGEALALRWRDFSADDGTLTIQRSAGMVRVKGEGAEMVEDSTKTSKPRVIDLDTQTVAVLRLWKTRRGEMALQLARPDSLIFGDLEGAHRNGEHVSRQFARDIARCREAIGEDQLPLSRLHDLRHTHATILLTSREPVHVVSQRLGHASLVITMTVYAHVLPGSQREAAERFARLIGEAGGA
jgi:integrase